LTLEPTTKVDAYTGKSYTGWHTVTHLSNIFKVDQLTEDKRSELLEGFALTIQKEMKWTINSEGNNVGKILSRKCLEFNSYSTASESHFKNENH
jgi:hypothetical protein